MPKDFLKNPQIFHYKDCYFSIEINVLCISLFSNLLLFFYSSLKFVAVTFSSII